IDRDPTRLHRRRDAELDHPALLIEAGDEQDVAPDLPQPALIDAAGAHPEGAARLPRTGVSVAEPADPKEALHVAQLVGAQHLVDRPWRGKQIKLVEPLPGARDGLRPRIPIP